MMELRNEYLCYMGRAGTFDMPHGRQEGVEELSFANYI